MTPTNQFALCATFVIAFVPLIVYFFPVLLFYFTFPLEIFDYRSSFYNRKMEIWRNFIEKWTPSVAQDNLYFISKQLRKIYIYIKNVTMTVVFFIPRIYTSMFIDNIDLMFLYRIFMTYRSLRVYFSLHEKWIYENPITNRREIERRINISENAKILIRKAANLICFFMFMAMAHCICFIMCGVVNFTPAILFALNNYAYMFTRGSVSYFGFHLDQFQATCLNLAISYTMSRNPSIFYGFIYGLLYGAIFSESWSNFVPFHKLRPFIILNVNFYDRMLTLFYIFLRRDHVGDISFFSLFKSLFYTTYRAGRSTGLRPRIKKVRTQGTREQDDELRNENIGNSRSNDEGETKRRDV